MLRLLLFALPGSSIPAEISAKHGGTITCYTDLSKMLADPDLHAVSICSYPAEHAKQAIMAARAGKHLIIEKPLALSWDDCLAVEAAVKKAGVKTCVCFECRFSSQLLTIKAVIDQGLLGKIHYGEVDYYHGIGPWYGQFRWNIKKGGCRKQPFVSRLSCNGCSFIMHGQRI